ncbi:hypothetical protein BCA37_08510 [Mycobacterium sp. djl-10]|nr:hypothetical protein BCA37_08510 [Mycobacterium sp. djl-10]
MLPLAGSGFLCRSTARPTMAQVMTGPYERGTMTHRTDGAASLTCSANTLRHADLRTRVAAAAAAGFTGVGLRVPDFAEAGMELGAIRDVLDGHQMLTLEVEYTWDWALPEVDPIEDVVFAFARTVGFRHLVVPMFYPHDRVDIVRGFGQLCDRAQAFGIEVGFEFLPYSHVRTLGQAWSIVEAAQRINGGVVLDLWHWFRSGSTFAQLAQVPVEKITSLQLCDVAAAPHADQTEEARHYRMLPGQGAGPTAAILTELARRGYGGPASVEVFSDRLDTYTPTAAAELAYVAGVDVLQGAGIEPAPWRTNLHQPSR